MEEHRSAANLSAREVDQVLDVLTSLAEPIETFFRWRPQLRDAGDELVLKAAVNGRADAIVTFNQRDFGDAPARFGIELLSPGEALRRLCERRHGRVPTPAPSVVAEGGRGKAQQT